MMGETVAVLRRTKAGEDAMGEPVWEWEPTTVENVLVRPLSSADLADESDALRPGRAMAGYSLAFPKSYAGGPLRGARVALVERGMDGTAAGAAGALRIQGEPDVTRPCPTLWNMTARAVRADG